jgi:hypothetical protein
MDWQTAKAAELGHAWSREDLKRHFKALCGGISWPSKRPGFVVVAGLSHDRHFETYDVYLLDEFESPDTRELVRRCGLLDYKYEPARWIGDPANGAADRFLRELNDERRVKAPERRESFRPLPGSVDPPRLVSVSRPPLLDDPRPYTYILPELKRLLDESGRQLFLKDSRIKDSLAAIDPAEIAEFAFGAYPAVEALASAVLELRDCGRYLDAPHDEHDDQELALSYGTETVL